MKDEEKQTVLHSIQRAIDEAIDPSRMGAEEALDFVEELAAHLEAVEDGLKDDSAQAEHDELLAQQSLEEAD